MKNADKTKIENPWRLLRKQLSEQNQKADYGEMKTN
jgi:hypothetical protein